MRTSVGRAGDGQRGKSGETGRQIGKQADGQTGRKRQTGRQCDRREDKQRLAGKEAIQFLTGF